jgi:hypothetical protein
MSKTDAAVGASPIATLALTLSPAKPAPLGRSGGVMAHPEPIQTRRSESVHPVWWMLPISICIYAFILLSMIA